MSSKTVALNHLLIPNTSELMTMTLEQFDWLSNKVSPFPPVSSPRSAVQRMGARRSRQRGVVLNEPGWRKLLAAKVLQNQWGEWHTFELLGDRTLVSPRTVSKIVGREVGVDRRTLNQFFAAFDLVLESGDYSLAGCAPKNSQTLATESQPLSFNFLGSAI
jgi:hypothetical protein